MNIEQLIQEALTSLKANKLHSAEAFCRQALQQQATCIPALSILGLVLHRGSRFHEAEPVFNQLTELKPAESLHWVNLGTARRAQGNFNGALSAYMHARKLGADSADFFYNIALLHLDRRDYESAREVLAQALQRAPEDLEIRFEYVRACYESLHTDDALHALHDIKALENLQDSDVASLGQQLMNLGNTGEARAAINQLMSRIDGLNSRTHLVLIQILERMNLLPQAREVLNKFTVLHGTRDLDAETLTTSAQLLQREGNHTAACQLFEKAITRIPKFSDQFTQLFSLAKSQDVLEQHTVAFQTLTKAHASQIEHLKLTAPGAVLRGAPTMEITQYHTEQRDVAEWNSANAPNVRQSPIFILAFPRSGTTLLELTLDAHPELVSTDEQPFVQRALEQLLSYGVRYPEALAKLTETQLAEIRNKYWQEVTRKFKLSNGQRLIDKNPLNLLRLPVIRRVFPNAKILLMVRHPCDVVMSCYMQQFRAPEFALLCSDLGSLSGGFSRSFTFWYEEQQRLEASVMEIRYENLVTDFTQQMKKACEFLLLDWHPAMSNPAQHAQNRGFISTPSYSQVVRPVNSAAIGRWRNYEFCLDEVKPILEPWFKHWGYDF
jgi:tetratricopeptide (TPR) repeat protein